MSEALLPETLRRLKLTLVAVEKGQVIADRQFESGETVSVGSNSGCSLVIPAKFELTVYTLVAGGNALCLSPPLYVQADVWWKDQVLSLKGHFRDLRQQHAGLEERLLLAGERFVVSYATGVVFLGRFGD